MIIRPPPPPCSRSVTGKERLRVVLLLLACGQVSIAGSDARYHSWGREDLAILVSHVWHSY